LPPRTLSPMQTLSCRHCRRYTYQPCFVAGIFQMSPHCANWHTCFPDASRCPNFEREPGSDDELGSAPATPQ
jgi:hypothetical protein